MCLEEITSKSMKLLIFFEEVLLSSDPGFPLFCVFHPAHVSLFLCATSVSCTHFYNNLFHNILYLFDYVPCPKELCKQMAMPY